MPGDDLMPRFTVPPDVDWSTVVVCDYCQQKLCPFRTVDPVIWQWMNAELLCGLDAAERFEEWTGKRLPYYRAGTTSVGRGIQR